MSEQQKKAAPKEHNMKDNRFYRFARAVFSGLFKTILPVRYHNTERMLIDAPFILMGNHQSMFDPVIAAVPIKKHQVHFLGKKELVTVPVLGKIFTHGLHMIPVDRHNTDMEAMRTCMKVTRNGLILGIFPEGTRHKSGLMEDLESGVAMIALRSKVPLVPVYITRRLCPFRAVHVYVGEQIPMDDLREQGINKETCDVLLKRITETYAEMVKLPAAKKS